MYVITFHDNDKVGEVKVSSLHEAKLQITELVLLGCTNIKFTEI